MGVFVCLVATSMVGGLAFDRPKGGGPFISGPNQTALGSKPPVPQTKIVLQGKAITLGKGVDVVLFFQRDGNGTRAALDGIDWVKSRRSKVAEFEAVVVRELVRNDPALITKTVEALRNKLKTKEGAVSVPVCMDHPAKPMSRSWMVNAGMLSFPCFFLTKDGVVQWVGQDPEDLDLAIGDLSKGKYSLVQAIQKERAINDWRLLVGRDSKELMSFHTIYDSPKTRMKVLDSVERSKRVSPERIALDRVRTLVELGDPAWKAKATQVLASPVGKSELWLKDAEQALDGYRNAKQSGPLRLLYLNRLETLHPMWQYEVRRATAYASIGQTPKAIAKLKSLLKRMRGEKAFPPSVSTVEETLRSLEAPVPAVKRA